MRSNNILAFVLAAAMGFGVAQVASAADMAVKARPMAAPAAFNWSGCYVGLNVGAGWGQRKIDRFDDRNRGVDDGNYDFDGSGIIGGGQLGCNWQSAQIVYGLEGDFQGTAVRSHNHRQPFDDATNMNFDMPWLSTIRGRIGYAAWDRVQVYATGGMAVAAVKYEADDFVNNGTDYTETKTRVGWTVGGGVEWALPDPRWSVKAEYLYVNLGNQTYIANDVGFTTNVQSNTNIVRVGLNYRFGRPF